MPDLTNSAVANATFADNVGANSVVGPIRSDLGYHVIKIDGITSQGGKTLAQARAEIIAKLIVDKRKDALADLIGRLEDEVADGKNFAEATAAVGIKPIRTPVITAGGVARAQPGYELPADLAPALRSGFELAQGDEPVVETLPGEAGYVFVGVDSIIASAPAPLAAVRAQLSRIGSASRPTTVPRPSPMRSRPRSPKDRNFAAQSPPPMLEYPSRRRRTPRFAGFSSAKWAARFRRRSP